MKLPKTTLSATQKKTTKLLFDKNPLAQDIKHLRRTLKNLLLCILYDKYLISLIVKQLKDLEKARTKKAKKKK